MMDEIILVHYVNIGNTGKHYARLRLEKYTDYVDQNEGTLNYIIPVRNESSRIECINPQLVSEAEFKSAKEVLDESQDALKAFMRSEKTGLYEFGS